MRDRNVTQFAKNEQESFMGSSALCEFLVFTFLLSTIFGWSSALYYSEPWSQFFGTMLGTFFQSLSLGTLIARYRLMTENRE